MDDLVNRLRKVCANPIFLAGIPGTTPGNVLAKEAAARIEAAEAKLAEEIAISNKRGNYIEFELVPALADAEAKVREATGALQKIVDAGGCFGSSAYAGDVDATARAALAKLRGEGET